MAEQKKGCVGKMLCYPASILSKCLNPPRLSHDSVLYWYIPMAGGASFTAFSIHIFNPNSLASIFPRGKHVVANVLLFNAHLGTGLYLFSRKHLAAAPLYHRIMFSAYGTLLFNFGSILLWALTKVILPDNSLGRGIFAVSTSLCMLMIGKEYMNYVDDRKITEKK